ncbi:unnamed protein product, partial [Prorocentrum cordatum]
MGKKGVEVHGDAASHARSGHSRRSSLRKPDASSSSDKKAEPCLNGTMRCFFRCGAIKGTTKCPIDPARVIEWEYENGFADKLCGRVYKSKYSHRMSRDEVQEEIDGQDGSFRDEFLGYRSDLAARWKSGKRGFSDKKSPTASRKRTLRKQSRHSTKLLPPPPDALPWDEYKEQYDEKLMKKAGHKLTKIQGKKMVLMPAEKGTPWKLQQEYATDLVDEEEIDSGNESGVGSDDDPVGDKFDDLVKMSDHAVEKKATGMTMQQLLQLAAEQGAKAAAGAEKGDGEEAAGIDGKTPSPNSKMRKQILKRRRGLGIISDTESDQPRAQNKKKVAKPKARPKPTATRRQTPALEGPKDQPKEEGAALPAPAPSGPAAPGKRGRAQRGAEENATREMNAFASATATSNFFNQHWFTANRCIKRYVEKALMEENAESDQQKKEQIGYYRKALQVIDEAQRAYQKWITGGAGEVGGLPDRVELNCSFLWEIFMEARASAAPLMSYSEVLEPHRMTAMFPDLVGKPIHLEQRQEKYVLMMVANILTSSMSASDAVKALRDALEPFRLGEKLADRVGGKAMAEDVRVMTMLVADVPESASVESVVSDLKEATAMIKGDACTDGDLGPLLSQLRKYKRLGDAVVNRAVDVAQRLEKQATLTTRLTEMKANTDDLLARDVWAGEAPSIVAKITRAYEDVSTGADPEEPACVRALRGEVDERVTQLHFMLLAQYMAAWTAQFGDAKLAPGPFLCGPDGFDFAGASDGCSVLATAGRFESLAEAKFALERLSAWFKLELSLRTAKDHVESLPSETVNQLMWLADFNPLKACEAKLRQRDGMARALPCISIDSVRMMFVK